MMSSKSLARRFALGPGVLLDVTLGLVFLAAIAMVVASLAHVSLVWPGLGAQIVEPAARAQNAVAFTPPNDTLELVIAGQAKLLDAGQYFPVGNNLLGRISVSRADASPYARTLDVVLYRTAQPSGSEQLMTSATVGATAHMLEMDMGTLELTAIPTTSGHYYLTMPFPMSGTWRVDLNVVTPTDQESVALNLVVRN
jgi:hypothetical protein